ncbi:ankyrin repeat domain-containing protein [Aestuariirhabdus sp. LZHN29]|uniref:ankyrin repeat domain-containing protein n=1 Tax=Aestuariirhabdus sp. LZHN29 TaxID=3417462 RepID=UPI003CECCD59
MGRKYGQVWIQLLLLCWLPLSWAGDDRGSGGSPRFAAIYNAAISHDQQALEQLKQGGRLDEVDSQGRSVLLRVTHRKAYEAMRLLIGLGVDVDHYESGLAAGVIDPTPLLYAGAHGDTHALGLLIAAGARTDILNYYGGTALIPAAEKGHVEAVRLLLEQSDVDVNHVNRLGWTALMEVVLLSDGGPGHQQILSLLLAHGADAGITDFQGVTAMEHAQDRGLEALAQLLAAQANSN